MILKLHNLISKDFRESKINLIFLKKDVKNDKIRIYLSHQRNVKSNNEKLKNLKPKLHFWKRKMNYK